MPRLGCDHSRELPAHTIVLQAERERDPGDFLFYCFILHYGMISPKCPHGRLKPGMTTSNQIGRRSEYAITVPPHACLPHQIIFAGHRHNVRSRLETCIQRETSTTRTNAL